MLETESALSAICLSFLLATVATGCSAGVPATPPEPIKEVMSAGPGTKCLKDADCGTELVCHELRCVQAEKKAAAADAGCRASSDCTVFGRCTAGASGCVATRDEDCRASPACKNDGWCTARGGWCIAATDADCRQSQVCRQVGLCTAWNEVCQ